MQDDVEIPADYWKTISDEEFQVICIIGGLNAHQCRSLWRMLERADAPPAFLTLMVNREEAMQFFQPASIFNRIKKWFTR